MKMQALLFIYYKIQVMMKRDRVNTIPRVVVPKLKGNHCLITNQAPPSTNMVAVIQKNKAPTLVSAHPANHGHRSVGQ